MTSASDTRNRLVAAGLEIMASEGYDAAGLAAILGRAGVPKGSFYHFFASKEDFGLAVLEAYEDSWSEARERLLGDGTRSAIERLHAYFDHLATVHEAESPVRGCLYGILAQTAGGRSPLFRDALRAVFARWEGHLAALIAEGQQAGEIDRAISPASAAAFLVDAYEGALVRLKVGDTGEGFARLHRFAIEALRA